MSYPMETLLNEFARRCFRDTADRDYIHARLAYRARLVQPFLWSSIHCLEKYVKGILMYNRIASGDLDHTVLKGLRRLRSEAKFQIELDPGSQEFLERLEQGAADRYFLTSYNDLPYDIIRLDQIVWVIRRYCQPLDCEVETDGKTVNRLTYMLECLKRGLDEGSKMTFIVNGWLETVLESDAKNETRKALIWKNLCFGPSTRRSAKFLPHFEGGNSPFFLYPEAVDEVAKLCKVPRDLREGCHKLATERKVAAARQARETRKAARLAARAASHKS